MHVTYLTYVTLSCLWLFFCCNNVHFSNEGILIKWVLNKQFVARSLIDARNKLYCSAALKKNPIDWQYFCVLFLSFMLLPLVLVKAGLAENTGIVLNHVKEKNKAALWVQETSALLSSYNISRINTLYNQSQRVT